MDTMELFNGILLIFALTTDAFVVSFAYGMEKVGMPFPIVIGMNLIMSFLLGIAVLAGNFLSYFLPEAVTSWICTGLLAGMGIYRILGCLFQKKKQQKEETRKRLTASEGMLLAFVLSLDSLAVGMGTGLVQTGELLLAAGSFAGGILMMESGWKLGYSFGISVKKDLSWLSGVCLVLLAVGLWCKG